MKIQITDINTDKVLIALADLGFGVLRTENPRRGHAGSDAALETAAIWTENGERRPGGYEVGIMRRELTSYTRHELILDTNRIPQARQMALLERIAAENR